jgi:hypothetical protein
MLELGVPGPEILGNILRNAILKCKTIKEASALTQYAALFEGRMGRGTRDVFHLEAFLAHAMVTLLPHK